MIGRHTYAPLIRPGDDLLHARDAAAKTGRTCRNRADELADLLDRDWRICGSAADEPLLDRLAELLVEATEIAKRLEK